MKNRNAVKLVGDVVSIEGTAVKLRTIQTRPSGSYEDIHVLEIPSQELCNGLKPKQKLELFGRLERADEPFSTSIVADIATVKKVGKSAGYENVACIVGTVPFTATLRPPTADGKMGLANLAIETGGKIFNGTAFRALAIVFGTVWTKGSVAQLMGRLRRREFIDANGDERASVEIVAEDQNETRVLKAAVVADPFGDYGTEPSPEAAPAL